jgi:hypothetical protein
MYIGEIKDANANANANAAHDPGSDQARYPWCQGRTGRAYRKYQARQHDHRAASKSIRESSTNHGTHNCPR